MDGPLLKSNLKRLFVLRLCAFQSVNDACACSRQSFQLGVQFYFVKLHNFHANMRLLFFCFEQVNTVNIVKKGCVMVVKPSFQVV